MPNPIFQSDSTLPLELIGFERDTAQNVYLPTRDVDLVLLHTLEASGYMTRPDIQLTDGRFVDGWVKF